MKLPAGHTYVTTPGSAPLFPALRPNSHESPAVRPSVAGFSFSSGEHPRRKPPRRLTGDGGQEGAFAAQSHRHQHRHPPR
jgi:hypothetical protein